MVCTTTAHVRCSLAVSSLVEDSQKTQLVLSSLMLILVTRKFCPVCQHQDHQDQVVVLLEMGLEDMTLLWLVQKMLWWIFTTPELEHGGQVRK